MNHRVADLDGRACEAVSVGSVFDSRELNERLFFPRKDSSPPPAGAVDLEVPGEPTLHVRVHRARAGIPTLLLFHGNGEVISDYDDSAAQFAEAGVNLAVMDYRGYGLSSGVPTLRNTLADAPRVLDAVRAHVAAPVIVMGRSLGSACAAALHADSPEGVLGFVFESGFVDLGALVRRRGMSAPRELTPDEVHIFDPVPKLARGRLPLMVLHGADDSLISPTEGQRAYDALTTQSKYLTFVPDRGHNDISLSSVYWAALTKFVAIVI